MFESLFSPQLLFWKVNMGLHIYLHSIGHILISFLPIIFYLILSSLVFMAAGDDQSSLSLNTPNHLLTIKLSLSNYIIWRNQILPLLFFHTDTISCTHIPNSEFTNRQESGRKALLIIQSSLMKEAMFEVLGLPTTLDMWTALENAYHQDFVERMKTLRDSL